MVEIQPGTGEEVYRLTQLTKTLAIKSLPYSLLQTPLPGRECLVHHYRLWNIIWTILKKKAAITSDLLCPEQLLCGYFWIFFKTETEYI